MVITIGTEAIKTTLYLAGPILVAAMVVGILVSIIQAVTQINESTLTFIPKIIAVVLVLTIMGPWMLEIMENYTTDILSNVGDWIR